MVVGESGKPAAIEVDREGVVTGAEDVDPHIELPTSEEQGIEDVALADIVLGVDLFVGAFPAVDICDLAENEDALPLALGSLLWSISTGFIIQRILSLSCCLLISS